MQKRKEVIRQGRYFYELPNGKYAVKEATPEKIARWAKDGNEMLSLGMPIPVPLEHDTQANPMNAADLAAGRVRNNTGFAQRFETDIIKDKKTGEDIHRLISVLDIRDEKAASKVDDATIPFVSPWFSTFTDGTGRKWDDVVAHVALTTRPRAHDQEPFALSAKLSLASTEDPLQGAVVSRAGLLKKDGRPRFLGAFSLMAGVKLSEEEIEEVAKESTEAGEAKAEAKEEKESDASPAKKERRSPMDDDEGDIEQNDVDIYEMITHLMKVLDMRPPDGMSEATFVRDIYETMMAAVKMKVAEQHNNQNANQNDRQPRQQQQRNGGQIQQEQPPMYMSLNEIMKLPADQRVAEINKITDPAKKVDAEAFLSLQSRIEATERSRLDEAEAERKKRIDKLLARLPHDMREGVAAQMLTSGAKLSLAEGNGAVVDPMDAFLSNMEKMADKLQQALGNRDMSKIDEQPQPNPGGMSAEDAKKLADDMSKTGTRMSAA